MSPTKSITPERTFASKEVLLQLIMNACKDGLSPNLGRYLRFVGVAEDEPVELVSLKARNVSRTAVTLATYAVGVDAIESLFVAADKGSDSEPHHNAEGLYLVPNLINAAVAHRLPPGRWEITDTRVKDTEIVRRRVLAIDCDPERPSGISATWTEHKAALSVGMDILFVLADLLGDDRCLGMGGTGNGCHVQLALDLPASPEAGDLCKRLLHAVDRRFTTVVAAGVAAVEVKIDTTVHNAARMLPAFGTRKRKGHPSKERPHRDTWFVGPDRLRRLDLDELKRLLVLLEGRIAEDDDEVVSSADAKAASHKQTPSPGTSDWKTWWAAVKAVPIPDVMRWLGLVGQDGKSSCPGCHESVGADALDNKLGVNLWKCHHNRCDAKGLGQGRYDTVALVMEAKSIADRKEAAKLIAHEFGVEPPRRKRGRPKRTVTVEALRATAQQRDVALPPGGDRPIKLYALTDLGNAERLVALHGDDLRFVGEWERWHVWDGTRWAKDTMRAIERRAHATARSILAEAAAVDDDESRAEIATWSTASESRSRTRSMIEQAQSMVCIMPKHMDQHPLLLNCKNGTVDLESGELRPHRRDDLLTLRTGVSFEVYDPFKAPTWERCLRRWQPDEDMRAFLQRLAGYSALGEVREHILPIHNGNGRNGKGSFLEALLFVLGDYATSVPEELLIENRHSDHPTLLATLYGKRLAVASETKQGDNLAMSRIKRLTGGDTIACRRMREDWWDFEPVHTLHEQTNHRPRITDTGLAAWERLLLITWAVTIPTHERDTKLKSKLRDEGPFILGWVVAGAVAYLRDGLQVPASVEKATHAWRAEEDLIGLFLSERCLLWEDDGKRRKAEGQVVDDGWYAVSKKAIYAAYREWAEEAGHLPKGKINFGKELVERGIVEYREDGTGDRMWAGVGLATDVLNAVSAAEVIDILAAV